MPAHPAAGDFFKQEDAKNVAEDCTRIVSLNASVTTVQGGNDVLNLVSVTH
jgi:hypothetical protein